MTSGELSFQLDSLRPRVWHGCGCSDCHAPPVVKPKDPAAKCHCRDTIASALARLAAQVQKEGMTK